MDDISLNGIYRLLDCVFLDGFFLNGIDRLLDSIFLDDISLLDGISLLHRYLCWMDIFVG